jgi:hypothetical protein
MWWVYNVCCLWMLLSAMYTCTCHILKLYISELIQARSNNTSWKMCLYIWLKGAMLLCFWLQMRCFMKCYAKSLDKYKRTITESESCSFQNYSKSVPISQETTSLISKLLCSVFTPVPYTIYRTLSCELCICDPHVEFSFKLVVYSSNTFASYDEMFVNEVKGKTKLAHLGHTTNCCH